MRILLSRKLNFIVLYVVATFLPVKACFSQGKQPQKSPSEHYRSTLYFDHLLELLKKDDTYEFTDEFNKSGEPESPSLEDLTNIFNEIGQGSLPQYLRDNDYNLTPINSSTTYNYSSANFANTGDFNSYFFSRLRNEGDLGTFSAIETDFITGQITTDVPDPYEVGVAVYMHARYTKGESFLNFQSTVLASFTMKLPNGIYVSYGNFTGMAEGNAAVNSQDVVEQSVKTLGILHNSFVYTKNVIVSNAKNTDKIGTNKVSVNSLTGGTNGTLTCRETFLPYYNVSTTGNLRNPHNEATMSSQSESFLTFNSSEPFDDDILFGYLWAPRVGIDLYLI